MRTPNVPLAATTLLAATFLLSPVTSLRAGPAYADAVTGDGAVAYYRFSDSLARGNVNANSGSAGSAGNATNYHAHAFSGALAGAGDSSQFYDSTGWAMIPYDAALNPPNTAPFTVEAWFYPASDQISAGQCPINNRYAYSGVNRQGWVFFQRAQDDSFTGRSGFEGVGWNFRMYNENGGSGALDVTSGVPFAIGKWTHVVVVYDPANVTDASLTMYIDGVEANTVTWNGGSDGSRPGYVANTDDHPAGEAVRGQPALALGAYNNTGLGSNPYFGAVDEFAFYAAKLTPAQILAHYQNGTNANRTTPYDALIKSANPVAYLRLDELSTGPSVALNLGDSRAAGMATNTASVRRSAQSALAGRHDDGSFAGRWHAGGGSFADIPWTVDNNPDASVPFTFEAWLRATADRMSPGPSPVNNRLASGIPNRTGWVIYQRDPNPSYQGPPAVSGDEGVGWNFRMYTGSGTGGQNVVTAVPYTMGAWQHLVVTWEPQTDVGPAANGGVAYNGTLTAYVDGVQVAQNTSATYCANQNPTEDGRAPADIAVGSYNRASGGGEEFEGNIDEVAFYNGYVLTADQILAHYQAGTNSHAATNYETLVLTAAYDGAGTQRLMPKTYLRFSEPAPYPAANSGSLGAAADATVVLTQNNVAGPVTAGFESANTALPLDGTTAWACLDNPGALNISGQITLEAWINPAATQGSVARILSHGPPTPTFYDLATYPLELNGSLLSSNEVFLRIEVGDSTEYVVGTSDGDTTHGARFQAPAGDLGGGQWVHLAGTYDGSHWNLYRNGVQVATSADTVGALPVDDAEWAIGSTGNGWGDFFAGSVDEVAIYRTALTPAQVKAHYDLANGGGEVRLTITREGNNVTLGWPNGTLETADKVTGPWSAVPGASAPSFTKPINGTSFYRVKL